MTKQYEHFVHTLDLTAGTNLVWNFIDCKTCHQNSQHKGSPFNTNVSEFKLCDRCEKELADLKKE